MVIQEDVKQYGQRYFQDKEQKHDTIVNRTNDLVDHAEKAAKTLLSVQKDVKHYGEGYLQDRAAEHERHDDWINLMGCHAGNTSEALLRMREDVRHCSEKYLKHWVNCGKVKGINQRYGLSGNCSYGGRNVVAYEMRMS